MHVHITIIGLRDGTYLEIYLVMLFFPEVLFHQHWTDLQL